MSDFLKLLILVVVCVGGYAAYRYASLPTHIMFNEWEAVKRLPAATCTFNNASFEYANDGVLRVYKGHIRIDSIDRQESTPRSRHAIVMPDRIVYSWRDGDSQGDIGPLVAPEHSNAVIGYPSVSCTPWWWPDTKLFVPPALVQFEE